MTESESAAVPAGPNTDTPVAGGTDDSIAAIRRQREAALALGDRETAAEFDALEREFYEAEAGDDRFESASPDDVAAPAFTEADHAPLTGDETAGVFAFLDEVDAHAAASLRAEWGGDAAANLGYAHLWFTTRYTRDERDSMVVTPGLVRMAARRGRGLAADHQKKGSLPHGSDPEAPRAGGGAHHEQAAAIRRRREDALRAGDHRLARRFDEEERSLYARLHGEGPIVGHAGRTL